LDDPEAMREHATECVEWMAGWLDATDDQEATLRTIALSLVDDLSPLAERHRARHGAFEALLRAPSIDRNELERLRRETIETADQASTRLAAGFADALDVLTAEQRAKLADHGARRHRWHHRHG
jgi:Spy/CpxP family protein refolding chaperone